MSLSTQLTRGTLALPMLALFGALALVAGRAAEAQSLPPQVSPAAQASTSATATRVDLAQSRDTLLVRTGESGSCATNGRPQLLLARAPADLGLIAQRAGACRA